MYLYIVDGSVILRVDEGGNDPSRAFITYVCKKIINYFYFINCKKKKLFKYPHNIILQKKLIEFSKKIHFR